MALPSRSLAAVLAGTLGACLPPPLADCSEFGCTEPPVMTTGSTVLPTTNAASDEFQTVTGDTAATSTGGPEATSTGDTTTTEAPELVPSIADFGLTPQLIVDNGLISVDVETLHADGVRMAVGEDVIELDPAGPDAFHGQIEVFSGVENGKKKAFLTPWRDDLEGATVEADYIVQLPAPGSQKFWEAGDLVGPGKVAALGVLPDGLLVELGSFIKGNESHCYLRRRQLDGSWLDEDFIELLPGSECTAIDMKIDPELGILHVVAEREAGDGLRWWLGEIASWGKGAKNNGLGDLGDKAEALAYRDDVVAVCGAQPVGDVSDAAVWVRQANQPITKLLFDAPNIQGDQIFAEVARDCVFADDTLVLVGEAFGKLDQKSPKRTHRFILEHDLVLNFDTWTMAGPGPGTQSRAHEVDVDDEGRYIVAGVTCGDVCEPDGEIRIYQPGGEVEWIAPLGPLNTELAGPHDIAWSPAGHVVVALAEINGQAFQFKVQGFAPGKLQPLWTFIPADMQGLQVAFALAIGKFGEVYAGGIGADNFPAVAYIAG